MGCFGRCGQKEAKQGQSIKSPEILRPVTATVCCPAVICQ